MADVRVYDKVIEVGVSVDTAAHAANDLVCQPIELEDAVRLGGCGVITSVVVADYDDQGVALRAIFLRKPIAVGVNNAALTIADGDLDDVLGYVSIGSSDYLDMAANKIGAATSCGLVVEPEEGSTSIWLALSTTGTPTYASGRLGVKVGILRG